MSEIMKADLLFPQVCIFCGVNACYDELPVCYHCVHKLNTLMTDKCIKCGKPPINCDCRESAGIRFAFYFGSLPSRKILYSFKYNADRRVIKFLAELLVDSTNIAPNSFDGVTYVPRIRRNIKRHGYDQAKELAKAISELYGIPLITALKRKGGKDQKLLDFSERKRNVKDKYCLSYIPEEKFKRILLVDDVMTTGATLQACSQILRKDFAKSVVIAVLAKTNGFVK